MYLQSIKSVKQNAANSVNSYSSFVHGYPQRVIGGREEGAKNRGLQICNASTFQCSSSSIGTNYKHYIEFVENCVNFSDCLVRRLRANSVLAVRRARAPVQVDKKTYKILFLFPFKNGNNTV
jgi:hypothetical protein